MELLTLKIAKTMKTKRIMMVLVMLMVSTLITRAQSQVFFSITDLASKLQKELNVPVEVSERLSEATAYVSFKVKEDGALSIARVWGKNLSEKSLVEVSSSIENLWESGVRYEGDERQFVIKVFFKTW